MIIMKISDLYTAPTKKGYEFLKDSYRKASNSKKTSVSGYTGLGMAVGGISGVVAGAGSGVMMPIYGGYKLGEFVSDKLDFGFIMTTGTDLVSIVMTSMVTMEVTIPVMAVVGGVAGLVVGAVAGTGVGVLKKI